MRKVYDRIILSLKIYQIFSLGRYWFKTEYYLLELGNGGASNTVEVFF